MDKVGDSAQQILDKIYLQFLSQYCTINISTLQRSETPKY